MGAAQGLQVNSIVSVVIALASDDFHVARQV
jgi:hypothetical protein